MAYESLMVFTGNANPMLAHAVVRRLNIPLGHATVGKFSDGEVMVELLENVRGKDCFVLQSTCAPANDSLMEVLLIVDALKRASAARVTAAIPYFGYGRQDRRPRSARVAISAKVSANMLQASGVDRVLTMDLHADQIQGFSTCRWTTSTRRRCCWRRVEAPVREPAGGCRRTWAAWCGPARWRSALESDLAIIDKRRPQPERFGSDERDRGREGAHLRDQDDIVDTANTLCKAAQALKEEARSAWWRIARTRSFPERGGTDADSDMDELVVTDSIPLSKTGQACSKDPRAFGRRAARRGRFCGSATRTRSRRCS